MHGNKSGFSPNERNFQDLLAKAAKGDIVFKCYPATVNRVATSAAWTRDVRIRLETASGDLHEWFTGDIASGVSIADTSSAGTAAIPSTTLSFKDGEAVVRVTGSAHAWLVGETDTLTVAQATIMGATVSAKTSVQTFIS